MRILIFGAGVIGSLYGFIGGLNKEAISKNEDDNMLLTIFLAVVFCASITLLLISSAAFVQYDGTNKWFFSSAPKEALALLKPRSEEGNHDRSENVRLSCGQRYCFSEPAADSL